ncbi:uncharacterized protein RCC_10655 [Ramularia collo-cygni]|uniref:Uncharacterized protein n=1 Tax=Ramularia collo-cygni TaxID=112498 RepID=A0A2D3V3R6_9PEZI|nr:uncharacterized protein RCC_10655 [Ramularia collo-cygni]CZT24927.1 uncharacterized protein RCC_10655 [Ramularia collo-cygni]
MEEVCALTDLDEMKNGIRKWLDEFPNQGIHLMVFRAAVDNHPQVITHLLELGISPTLDHPTFIVPFHAACANNNNIACAKILLTSGLDINTRDEVGGTPLMRAAVGGHTEIVRWLLANNAVPKTP